MRWRKLLASLLLAIVTILDAVSLGWSVANEQITEIGIYAINVAFAIYLLTLAIRSINQNNAPRHSESVLHLTTITTLATVFLGTIAILPSAPPNTTAEIAPTLWYIWHVKLCLYAIVCVMMYMTPQGPRLHFPPERIFSEKTILAITNTDEENVCGITGKSACIPFKLNIDDIGQGLLLGISCISHIPRRSFTLAMLLRPSKPEIYPLFLQPYERTIITPK
jgi:hypothetical protein